MDQVSKSPDPPIMSVQLVYARQLLSQPMNPYHILTNGPVMSILLFHPVHEPTKAKQSAPELNQFGHYIDPRIKKETREEEGVLSYIF